MRIFSILISLFLAQSIFGQSDSALIKKSLDHSVYNTWKNTENTVFTDDGQWLSYTIKPAKGDGFLYIYNTETGIKDSIPRGKNAKFDANNTFIAFLIEPQYDTLRALKLKKVAKNKLPIDSLGIYILNSDSLIKIPKVKSFSIPDSLQSYLVYTSLEEEEVVIKLEEAKKKHKICKKEKVEEPKPIGPKPEGDKLVLYFPTEGKILKFDYIDEFVISNDGNKIAFIKNGEDKKNPKTEINIYKPISDSKSPIFSESGLAKSFSFSKSGDKWAFLHSADTVQRNKVFSLYYGTENEQDTSFLLSDSTAIYSKKGQCISEFEKPYFSENGTKLFFGIAPKPKQEPKDTLLDEEKVRVDIWNYQDDYLQPQQLLRVMDEKQKTYLCFYNFETKNIIQIEDEIAENARLILKGDGNIALVSSDKKYRREQSWGDYKVDYYVVNLFDGSKEIVLEAFSGSTQLSTEGNYLLYFKVTEKAWYSYDIKARRHQPLTKNIKVNFYDEEHDMPSLPNSYGIAGWYKGDKYVVIFDRYDLWQIDPTGKTTAKNLTNNYGRKHKIKFRNLRLDPDHIYFNDELPTYLYGFNETNKQSGYFVLESFEGNDPKEIIMSDYSYQYLRKPKKASMFFWRRMSFNEYPEIYQSDLNFQNIKKITNTNPQQSSYLWGSVEIVQWKAFDGQKLSGLVYKPENFDSTKKYPMIVYFYDRYSDDLHLHYIPKPSHSVINFTEYTSNGYLVFVPDITYKIGHPAKSAYNAIVSGTEFMKKNSWVNAQKIGLQGQSWGGYQTAMLVTMTDIYACAEAGAPVSNMTSAYGGIRWGTGMSRAFQYEKTQSRIGYTLWDSTQLYIENSPLFFANKVKTPLLIMHNDKDGAVPWYQGIEYFSALRRLDKKVWMLTYNFDDHNLDKWANRVDLSIRMQQFFDHYLKDAPMPIWMSKGLPAVDKGIRTGYELDLF